MANDYTRAVKLAQDLVDAGEDFRLFTRDELKTFFEIGRLTDVRVDKLCSACTYAGLILFPAPKQDVGLTRVYLADSIIGRFVDSMISPSIISENERVFEKGIHRVYSATPGEVYKKIKDVFEKENWVHK